MEVLLINPFSWTRDGRPAYLPYGVLYLAGYLKHKGIDVRVFDCNAESISPVDVVRQYKPKYVGLSVLSGPVIQEAINISKEIKQQFPDVKIIWGGLHPTLFPNYVLNTNYVDFVIQGEGEFGMYEIVSGTNTERLNHSGMEGKFVDLDSFWPAWDLVDVNKYIVNRFYADRTITMNTSRGCIFRCHFCFNQGLKFQKWRCVSAENMFAQISYLKDKYNINGIQFYEDCFDVNRDRVRKFCEYIEPLNISWEHFSNVTLADQDLLIQERKAGCKYIAYGVESGSDRILKFINKKQTVGQIRDAFNKCKKAKIKATALFMVGLPTETKEDLKQTVKLIDSLPSHVPICTIYRPYPSTPLYEWCVKNKGFKEPQSLEEQAEFYAYGKLENYISNVSEVETSYLVKLQDRFLRQVIIKEILYLLLTFNFRRIIYHLRNKLNFGKKI